MLKKIVFTTFSVLMGLVFLLSGFTKGGFPFPYSSAIEPFEYTFVDLGIVNWELAPFVARLLISIEFFIGLLLIFNIKLKKIAYRLGIAILILFSLYLILLISFAGNKSNCGCFGNVFIMTPMWALLKNGVMLFVFAILYRFHDGFQNEISKYLVAVFLVTAIALPFIWNPIEFSYSEAYLNKPAENYKIQLDSLYNNAKLNIPSKTLSQGKHILVFLSLTCPHCRIAANKIRIINKRNSSIPFYFILNGDAKNLQPFFDDTHSKHIPHCLLSGRSFVYLAGTRIPAIYLVNNSMVESELNYIELDQGEIEAWLKR